MKNKHIKIVVMGKTGTGKTTIGSLIYDYLKNIGIDGLKLNYADRDMLLNHHDAVEKVQKIRGQMSIEIEIRTVRDEGHVIESKL